MLVNNLHAILVVHMGEAKSRAFMESLTAMELASFDYVIDWHNPADLYKVKAYQNDRHYPTGGDFPWVLVHLPWTHFNYKKKFIPDWVDGERRGWRLDDQVALLQPKQGLGIEAFTYEAIQAGATEVEKQAARRLNNENGKFTYEDIQGAAMDAMVEAIIENVMMSESYRVSHCKMEFMLNSKISREALLYFNSCQTVAEMMAMYQRLDRDGVLIEKDAVMIEEIKNHCGVDFDEMISLNTPIESVEPIESVDLPVGARQEAVRLIKSAK